VYSAWGGRLKHVEMICLEPWIFCSTMLARAFLQFMELFGVFCQRWKTSLLSIFTCLSSNYLSIMLRMQRHVNNTMCEDMRWLVGCLWCPWSFCLLTHISNISSRYAEYSKSKYEREGKWKKKMKQLNIVQKECSHRLDQNLSKMIVAPPQNYFYENFYMNTEQFDCLLLCCSSKFL
jgi:hypothetical protein